MASIKSSSSAPSAKTRKSSISSPATRIAPLSVATNESWKDKNGEKQERTEWHRVKFTRKLAEIVGEYVKKGHQIYVEGSLRTEKYTDKQGVERYSTDIVANEMQMLGSKSGGGERGPRSDEGSGWSGSSNDGFSTPKPAAKPAPKPAESYGRQ